MVSPDLTATRTFLPSRTSKRTRVALPLLGSATATLEIAIGAFDDRSDLAPQIQVNYGSRLPWVEAIFSAPVHDDPDYYSQQEKIISFQHPDHETENWPAHGMKL